MARFWLAAAALCGFLAVALGAFGAHGLKTVLDEYGRIIWEKAVLYQMFHTVGLLAVGLLRFFTEETAFSAAGWFFLAGIVLFSGSLYILALTGIGLLGIVTPFGGVAFLIGWAWLGFAALRTGLERDRPSA